MKTEEVDQFSILRELDKYSLSLLLEAALSKFGPFAQEETNLKSKLAVLSSLISVNDRIADSSFVQKSSSYPRKSVIYAVSASLSAPDFYAIEYSSYGPPTRWTGPSRHFSFDLFVDRSVLLDFVLDFEIVYFSHSLDEILCFVDGRETRLTIQNGGGGHLASGVLPVCETKGASVITFVCPDVKSPRENGLPDDRLLGVRFRHLTVAESKVAAESETLRFHDQPVDNPA